LLNAEINSRQKELNELYLTNEMIEEERASQVVQGNALQELINLAAAAQMFEGEKQKK
jgi:hypothetical protein